MTKWEYTTINGTIKTVEIDELNKLGAQGWELVAVTNLGWLLFKRPLYNEKPH